MQYTQYEIQHTLHSTKFNILYIVRNNGKFRSASLCLYITLLLLSPIIILYNMSDRVKKGSRRPKKRRTQCRTVTRKTIADDNDNSSINVEDGSSTSTEEVPKLSVDGLLDLEKLSGIFKEKTKLP